MIGPQSNVTDDDCVKTETQRRQYDNGDGDWSGPSISQGLPRTSSLHQKLGERYGIYFPSEHSEGTNHDDTLILDFLVSRIARQ